MLVLLDEASTQTKKTDRVVDEASTQTKKTDRVVDERSTQSKKTDRVVDEGSTEAICTDWTTRRNHFACPERVSKETTLKPKIYTFTSAPNRRNQQNLSRPQNYQNRHQHLFQIGENHKILPTVSKPGNHTYACF